MILPAFGLLLFLVIWVAVLQRWQRGIVMLLAYLPFAGVVTLSLYPLSYPVLFKDFYFVIPTYLTYWIARRERLSAEVVPSSVRFAMLALAAMVLLQSFNPQVDDLLVAAIGAKVWLFYLPMVFLSFELIQSRSDLIRILRLMVAITWIPCSIGILEWVASMTYGYQETMYAIYGAAAEGATQNFVYFDVGGEIFRIPSTFTFVTQYFGYALAMMVPAYALSRLEDSLSWRRFSNITLWLAVLAAFMSGARAAYLLVPLMLFVTYFWESGLKGALKIVFMLPPAALAALFFAGIDPTLLLSSMKILFLTYSDSVAAQGLLDAINIAPLGMGAGMNTGPARYAMVDPTSFIGIENYYAKVVVELGVIGLLIVVALFAILIRYGYAIQRNLHDPGLRSTATAILAFIVTIVLSSFKGWQIDLDPINVYFWMFAGFLFKLEHLDRPSPVLADAKEKASAVHGVRQRRMQGPA